MNPLAQQYESYDSVDNIMQNHNLSNINYNVIPNYDNTGDIYHNNIKQGTYIVGSNNQIIENYNDGFNLFNLSGYV